MRPSDCDHGNLFFWRELNWTQCETKDLWAPKHVLLKSIKFNTVWEKGLWAAKHVLLRSVKFNEVWDKVFVSSLTCSLVEC